MSLNEFYLNDCVSSNKSNGYFYYLFSNIYLLYRYTYTRRPLNACISVSLILLFGLWVVGLSVVADSTQIAPPARPLKNPLSLFNSTVTLNYKLL